MSNLKVEERFEVTSKSAQNKVIDLNGDDKVFKQEKARQFTIRDGLIIGQIQNDEMKEAIKLYAECQDEIKFKRFYVVEDPIEWCDSYDLLMPGIETLKERMEEMDVNCINEIKKNTYYKYMLYMYELCKKYK